MRKFFNLSHFLFFSLTFTFHRACFIIFLRPGFPIMELFSASILASIIFHVGQSEDPMIITYHEGVTNYFHEMSQNEEQSVQKAFKKWPTDVKISVCQRIVSSVLFHVINRTDAFKYGFLPCSWKNLQNRVQFTYGFGEMDAVNYTVVKVDTGNGLKDVVVHLCVVDHSYQAAIASTRQNDVYFYFDKTSEKDYFKVSGITDLRAIVHPFMNHNLKQLMIAYVDNLNKQLERKKHVRSFCSLDDHRKLRLCSLAYVSFMEQNNFTVDRINHTRVEDGCLHLKEAKILFELKNNFYYFITDLISCNIDTATTTLKFYLAMDPYKSDSAYIVRKSKKNPPNPYLLGNFSCANENNVDLKKTSSIVKNFKMKLRLPKAQSFANFDQQIHLKEGEYRTSDDSNVPGSFYLLQMLIMKLTPLMDSDN